ncbi:MAG: co-chaperone GroES [bacterium]|nr:co-chaperone GroES [bacterium]
MNVKPLADRVVVRPLAEQETKKGGIIIPDTAKEKPMEGEIIAVGEGRISDEGKKMPLEVKSGDKVLYGKYSGTEVSIDGDEYLIMRESDIFAVITNS